MGGGANFDFGDKGGLRERLAAKFELVILLYKARHGSWEAEARIRRKVEKELRLISLER